MEQPTTPPQDYRQMTANLMNENKLNFLVGSVIVLAVVISLFARYGGDMSSRIAQGVSSTLESIRLSFESTEGKISNLSSSLTDPKINYISPAPTKSDDDTSQLGIVSEDGQISAISSGQVTYKQNKYVLQPGESLATVAEKVYGDRNAWVRIAQANNIKDPDHVEVGMELIIPR